jgi:hypothetical protein
MDPSMGEMHGSDLFGYNASDAKLHCFSVDNMGSSKDQICEWKSPDHLIIQYSGTSDGKQIEDRLDFTFTGDDVLDFSGTSTADGKTQWSGTGTFHKVQDK